MKNRIVYILLLCIGFWLAPKASQACASRSVKSKTCHVVRAAKQTLNADHTCCHKHQQGTHMADKRCGNHPCKCPAPVRNNFDTSLTAPYSIDLAIDYPQSHEPMPVTDQLFLSAGFYSCWLPPKI